MTSREEYLEKTRKQVNEADPDSFAKTSDSLDNDCEDLWDEIIYMNLDESKLKLVKRTRSDLVLKALVKEAFTDKYIMSHLLASLMFPDCRMVINKSTFFDEKLPEKGKKIFSFELDSKESKKVFRGKITLNY